MKLSISENVIYRRLLVMAFSILALVGYCADAEVVKVRGRGVGLNKIEALKDAYRDAIENAVGLYVDAEQFVKNEDLVKDQILTQSNAYIENYKVVKTGGEQGLVAITIIADVRKLALTRRIKEVMPTQKIALSEQSQNLHAEIVTDFKRKADAVALLKNELDNLSPVKQLMKVTIGAEKNVFEPVKEDANLVRVWYPINVEVDKTRYYKEFAPRMSRILDQIKIGPSKRLDMVNNLKCAKEYEDYLTKEFGRSRTGRTGIMTRSTVRRSDSQWDVEDDALKGWGISLNQEYRDICFLDSIILGNKHIVYGVGCLHKNRSICDERYVFSDAGFVLPFFFCRSENEAHWYSMKRTDFLPEDCIFHVGIVDRKKGGAYSGRLFKMPYECVKEITIWQEKWVGTWDVSHLGNQEGVFPKTVYSLSLVDGTGEEVSGTTFVIRNMDVINFTCNILETPKEDDRAKVGGSFLWNITPLVGGFAKSYVKWISVDIPKDDVAKIANATISVEE